MANNTGDADGTLSLVSAASGFVVTPTSITVAANSSVELSVTFTPQTAGTLNGQIVMNYAGGEVSINVSGEGLLITGIDNGEVTAADVYLYPNPASSILTIDLIKFNGLTVDIGIFDASGSEKLDIRNITDSALRLDVSNYGQGVFIIMIKSEKSLIRKKVIIKR